MRFVFLADTHMKHERVVIPDGDVLIFCGDMCTSGTIGEATRTCHFLNALPHKYKIIVPGNHDWPFTYMDPSIIIPKGMIYLCDDIIHIRQLDQVSLDMSTDISIYGMPWTPLFYNWAFMFPRNGSRLKARVNAIPGDIDILVTHGPPKGIKDAVPHYDKQGVYTHTTNEGCELLRARVLRTKPKVHVFGHIHDTTGFEYIGGTLYINATICNRKYHPEYSPVVVDYVNKVATVVEAV